MVVFKESTATTIPLAFAVVLVVLLLTPIFSPAMEPSLVRT